MNKKDVHAVDLLKLNSTVKHGYLSNGSDVLDVSKHSSGEHRIIESIAGDTGSSYGSPRITAYDRCLNNPDTANSSLNRSKITGLIDCLRRSIITDTLNILSMMRPTSIRMAVL
jgi:hypothetical protein